MPFLRLFWPRSFVGHDECQHFPSGRPSVLAFEPCNAPPVVVRVIGLWDPPVPVRDQHDDYVGVLDLSQAGRERRMFAAGHKVLLQAWKELSAEGGVPR